MNYYERIQRSIDYMEDNLENMITVDIVAKEAYMSLSNYYRMFFAMTGFQVKEYIINRRISKAANELRHTDIKIIDIAMKYSYNSVDAFSRIFKKITGHTPSSYSKGNYRYTFERIDLMKQYFDDSDKKLMEDYPDIKVINTLPSMKVAYYCYYGKDPESAAFEVMREWVLKNKLDIHNGRYRIFGYNAPDSMLGEEEYGYEVCITIPDDMVVTDEKVKSKVLQGGLYAVMSINGKEDLGEEIAKGWQRFAKWVDGSKYRYGEAQYLEEHLGFSKEFEHEGGVDLYMPICLKSEVYEGQVEEVVEPFTVATYTAIGRDAEKKAKEGMFNWMKEQCIPFNENTKVFAFYNFEKMGTKEFFFKMYVKIDDDKTITDSNIEKEQFPGGRYLKRCVNYKNNANSWFDFIRFMEESDTYEFDQRPFMEEYCLHKPAITIDTIVYQHMAIK